MLYKSLSLSLLLLLLNFNLSAQWKHTNGPHGRSEAIYTITLNGSEIYAGTSEGIYYSDNDGESWRVIKQPSPINQFDNILTVHSLAIDIDIIYRSHNMIYFSSNKGETWSSFEGQNVSGNSDIIVNDELILTGYEGSSQWTQSTDAGNTWINLSEKNIQNVVSGYVDDSIAIVSGYEGIYTSTDRGLNWNFVHANSQNYDGGIAVSGSHIYVAMGNYVLHSPDKGITWDSDSSFIPCDRIKALAAAKNKSGDIFIWAGADSGMFRSDDMGKTWNKKNNGFNLPDIRSLAWKYSENEEIIIYAGTTSGIYKSTDLGENWVCIGVPSGKWVLSNAGSTLYAGTTGTYRQSDYHFYVRDASVVYNSPEIFYSSDGGLTWIDADMGIAGKHTELRTFNVVNKENEYTLFMSTKNGYLFKTDIFDKSWSEQKIENTSFIKSINSDSLFIIAGTGGLLIRSTDGGISWEKSAPNIAGTAVAYVFYKEKIYGVLGGYSYDYDDYGYMIFTFDNRILSSDDKGINWSEINSDYPLVLKSKNVLSQNSCLLVNNNQMLIGRKAVNSQFSRPSDGGVYHLVNQDGVWSFADSSLIGEDIYSLVSYNNDVFATTDGGIYHSTDFGTTWNDIGQGLDDSVITSVTIMGTNLYTATKSGVWVRSLSEITSVENNTPAEVLPSSYNLSNNFPNPFNPTTNIKYTIPSASKVELKVFDVLGREVTTLVNEEKPAGEYSINFNASNLASGIYFYRIKAGEYTQTKRMVLMK